MKFAILPLFLFSFSVASAQALAAQTNSIITRLADTLKLVQADTIVKKDSLSAPPSVKKPLKKVYSDKIITSKGDTILGQIRFEKASNKFFFKNDDPARDSVLSPNNLTNLSIAATDSTDMQEYQVIINEFYRLETGKGEAITCFAKNTYKTSKNKGEKVQILQKQYCLIKNDALFFLNRANAKEALLSLLMECPLVVDKVKVSADPDNHIPAFVKEYNQCFKKR